jgi:hypothetical protein
VAAPTNSDDGVLIKPTGELLGRVEIGNCLGAVICEQKTTFRFEASNEFLAFGPSTMGFIRSKFMSLSSGRKRGSFLVELKEKVD